MSPRLAVAIGLALAACSSACANQRTVIDFDSLATFRRHSAPLTNVALRENVHGVRRRLTVLTYNVAGLPQWLSAAQPRRDLPRIGELMNGYDLVLAQEDFAYPGALRRNLRFHHQTAGRGRRFAFDLGDGLSRFANHPFAEHARSPWSACNGRLRHANDCLADKGFSVATHEVAPGALLDVYNVHFDAGGSRGDIDARRAQVLQLVQHIRQHSRGRAVLIAGDTNLSRPSDRQSLLALMRLTGCQDVCRTLDCGDPERVDRVLIRSSERLRLTALDWRIDDRFISRSGQDLSDHKAVAVTLEVRSTAPLEGMAAR